MEEFDPASGIDPDDHRADGEGYVDAQRYHELLEAFQHLEDDIEDRTVHREELEADLKRYVRWRQRRGHVRGWGPYLVMLYGVVLTLGAFFYLDGGWAVAAMLIIWLSTLGLYVFMIVTGATIKAATYPLTKVRNRR